MINSGVYVGTIVDVLPPSHPLNDSKGYQYIYEVAVATEKYAYLPVWCIRMDITGGGVFNFEDVILGKGNQVFMAFPFEDTSKGVILGGPREETNPVKEEGLIRWEKRFNEISQSISFDGVWKLQYKTEVLTSGPSMTLSKDTILIDDGGPTATGIDSQYIEVDPKNKTIKIKSGEWTLEAKTGVTINVASGDVSINCVNTSISSRQSIDVKAASGDVSVEGLNVNVKAKKQAVVEGTQILLNSKMNPLNGVITTTTQPTCYVTGIPFRGSTTVLAGS